MSNYYYEQLTKNEVLSLRAALLSDVIWYHALNDCGKWKDKNNRFKKETGISILCWLEALGGLGAVW